MPKSKRQKVATSPRRFELIIDGVQFRCAAFESAHKLDALLTGHCAKVPAPEQIGVEPRLRGRPPFDQVISAALQALGDLGALATRAARVRCVLREIARPCSDPTQIPSRDTVERYLRNCEGQKTRQDSPQKSRRVKVAATGD